jgi:hypothetical protein
MCGGIGMGKPISSSLCDARMASVKIAVEWRCVVFPLPQNGGGIFANGNITVEYSAFTNNMVHSMNMAVCLAPSRIARNVAKSYGARMCRCGQFLRKPSYELTGLFHSRQRGAGLYVEQGAVVTIRHSLFDANIGNIGPAMSARGSANIFNTTFSNNEGNLVCFARKAGNIVKSQCAQSVPDTSYNNTIVQRCTCDRGFRGIDGSLVLECVSCMPQCYSWVLINSSSQVGGALAAFLESTIDNCTFENNIATGEVSRPGWPAATAKPTLSFTHNLAYFTF